MSARPRRAAARDTLDPIQLIEYVQFVAAEVAAGRYPYVRYDEQERWHQRLYRDRRVDLWLISWLPTQGTQLHDHGGSSGAFTVVSGELSEAIHQSGPPGGPHRLVERAHTAGASVGFGSAYVHDVRNISDQPAVSVHAYSAPLTTMNFYDFDPVTGLDRLLTLDTDDPEPVVTEADLRPGSAA